MKTLVVFSDYETLPKFYLIDGAKQYWNGVTVGAGAEDPEMMTPYEYDQAESEIAAWLGTNPKVCNAQQQIEAFKGVAEHRYYLVICGQSL